MRAADGRKIHLFHFTSEELEAMSGETLKSMVVDCLERLDLHKGAYLEIAQIINKDLDYMRKT